MTDAYDHGMDDDGRHAPHKAPMHEATRHEHEEHGHDGHRGHPHSHGVAADADVRLLMVALGLIGVFMAGEVVAAVVGGSLALFADAGHMLTDVGALWASVWAIRLAARPAA